MPHTVLGAGNRAVSTTQGLHTPVGEKQRKTRKQTPFQMVLKDQAGKTLHNRTKTKRKGAVLHMAQERSL